MAPVRECCHEAVREDWVKRTNSERDSWDEEEAIQFEEDGEVEEEKESEMNDEGGDDEGGDDEETPRQVMGRRMRGGRRDDVVSEKDGEDDDGSVRSLEGAVQFVSYPTRAAASASSPLAEPRSRPSLYDSEGARRCSHCGSC
jgi:hypothetical protein